MLLNFETHSCINTLRKLFVLEIRTLMQQSLELGFYHSGKNYFQSCISEASPFNHALSYETRGGSRIAVTSKIEYFVTAIITKRSILDVTAVLDPPLG